jgi:epoxyqueuosine reductase
MRPLRPAPATPGPALRDAALALGFDAVGFAPADGDPVWGERLAAFLASGHHGAMGWLADTADRRARPTAMWPEARSAIVVAMNYGPDSDPLATLAQREAASLSVYARNRDYHDVLKRQLRVLARFVHQTWGAEVKIFVDTAPLMEKPLAQAAGLGWQGKHTNLVSRSHGSWLFLGSVLTTLEISANARETDHCGSCSACLEICPTAAFPAPYQLDARRCISYLTIEHHGPIPEALRPLMGNRIYGCDDCLAVCPWNKFARATPHPEFAGRADLAAPALAELAQLDDAGFRARFSGSPIKRIGRDRFVRNVLIAIGNSGSPALIASAAALTTDPDSTVADAASWAVRELSETHAERP